MHEDEPLSLPDKPSRLIHTALSDLRAIEADGRYRVHMGQWHSGYSGEGFPPCYVCLAGAVMARSLHAPIHQGLCPVAFPKETIKLVALNELRCGHIGQGLGTMGLERPFGMPEFIRVPLYHSDPAGFKAALRGIQSTLEKAGL